MKLRPGAARIRPRAVTFRWEKFLCRWRCRILAERCSLALWTNGGTEAQARWQSACSSSVRSPAATSKAASSGIMAETRHHEIARSGILHHDHGLLAQTKATLLPGVLLARSSHVLIFPYNSALKQDTPNCNLSDGNGLAVNQGLAKPSQFLRPKLQVRTCLCNCPKEETSLDFPNRTMKCLISTKGPGVPCSASTRVLPTWGYRWQKGRGRLLYLHGPSCRHALVPVRERHRNLQPRQSKSTSTLIATDLRSLSLPSCCVQSIARLEPSLSSPHRSETSQCKIRVQPVSVLSLQTLQ